MSDTIIKLESERDVDRAQKLCETLFQLGKPHEVVFRKVQTNRSLAQNRLSHMHYTQIADQVHEGVDETKARIKLNTGIPLLLASERFEEFARRWTVLTKRLAYEEKLRAASLVPVTSLMGVKMMSEYITQYMNEHEAQGIELVHPSELFYEAMNLTRKD